MSFKNGLSQKIVRRKLSNVLFAVVLAISISEAVVGEFAVNRLNEYSGISVTSSTLNRRPEVIIAVPRADSSPAFLRSYMSAAAASVVAGDERPGNAAARPPAPLAPPPLSSNSVGRENEVNRRQLASSSAPSSWRWCHICSGKYPDRECELYPKRVTRGPAKTNCTKGFCTSYVRYKPKAHLITEDENKKPVSVRPLEPDDFDVTSIARECESFGRGNTCIVDGDQLGVTCYSSCTTHFCNDDTRRPSWQHFRQQRQQHNRERHPGDREEADSTEDDVDGRYEPSQDGFEDRSTNEISMHDRQDKFQGGEDKETRLNVVARRLPEENQIHRGHFDRNGLLDHSEMAEHGVHSKLNNAKNIEGGIVNGTDHPGTNGTSRTPGQFLPEPAKSKSGKPSIGLTSGGSTFRSSSLPVNCIAVAVVCSLGFLRCVS